ncbi:MAG TPA: prepilin-type N-terminal cleavage/methylation domain-containing protein [Lapidilactobacillus dextrinicus]|uniref:Prepilin-type N-terminal cleavage/methylation domain-containing protein n=1 Tax=Lapidilactobacillus dextrinicus TaxID=51664 RepID=A0A921B322_9LACO|nr:prepilin-type N-terminal cleavage/methylation domain-containing protein [Lapidilactobacillus dextrinicus]
MKFLSTHSKKRSAFTLIEMSLVLLIIAMLLIVMLPNLNQQKGSAQKSVDAAFAKNMETQVMLYESENGQPTSWGDLQTSGYITKEQADKAGKMGLEIAK